MIAADGAACAGVGPAARLLAIATGVKLAWEASILIRLADRQLGSLRRTALLLVGDLRAEAGARLLLGVLGGVLAPLGVAHLADAGAMGATGNRSHGALIVAAVGALLLVGAELCERALFFRAASPPRMPGSV